MTQQRKFRVAILGSGKGSNMVSLAESFAGPDSPVEIVLVISDVPDAGILERARERRITSMFLDPGKFKTKLDDQAEQRYCAALKEADPDLIALAGFMRILKRGILGEFPHRVINIHPALLPAFPGLQAWKQALDYGVKHTGCTVHFVDEGIDTGPIIAQHTVPVMDNDTPETLHARIQKAEHVVYPAAVKALALGQVQVLGRRTFGVNGTCNWG